MSAGKHTKVLIIGAGSAGLTAAIYAARANLSPVVIQGLQPGGQLTITTDVENYPGFAEVIQGPWLMEQMAQQAAHCGAELLFDLVAGVDLSERPFRVWLDGGATWTADALIIATGAQARWLGLDSERHFSGAGVSAHDSVKLAFLSRAGYVSRTRARTAGRRNRGKCPWTGT